MKKLFLLISILAFFTGCSNLFNDEVSVGLVITPTGLPNTRAVDSSVTKLELWISDPGVDYKFVQEEDYDHTQFFTTVEDELIDLEGGVVRNIYSNSNSIDFSIRTNIEKTFTVRVVYETGWVFMGHTTQAISPYVSTIQIKIYETAFSVQNRTFEDWNDFIKD
ncbi:hypothetical protein EW093_04700 [Thiospirochaeta perfilievii]|uniref:Uncharacterized protein n=1 Tax=Thiospirochaeta perfilievii TaxID=252967 RepID=A0A5C1QAT6_9SPIO|nr:hypothetical protein [Thiospirochaeta perfilievii]QEN04029.1 hypothetical protein EW093_04700 [Thiospirochaeta perfilievii]